jgi:hypothetical protein
MTKKEWQHGGTEITEEIFWTGINLPLVVILFNNNNRHLFISLP